MPVGAACARPAGGGMDQPAVDACAAAGSAPRMRSSLNLHMVSTGPATGLHMPYFGLHVDVVPGGTMRRIITAFIALPVLPALTVVAILAVPVVG